MNSLGTVSWAAREIGWCASPEACALGGYPEGSTASRREEFALTLFRDGELMPDRIILKTR